MITGSGVLRVFSCHVRYIEDCQWTGINKAFIGVKGFSLAYLRVIHFETSRLNIKVLHEFSSFSSEVFPSILKITQNAYLGNFKDGERSWLSMMKLHLQQSFYSVNG